MVDEDPQIEPDADAPVQVETRPDGTAEVLINGEVAAELRPVEGPSGRAWAASNVEGGCWPARHDAVAAAVKAHLLRR
ncbi:MAG: hypothetical protein S0880_02525 [Actinomycetota bacterium]|nr:hypothetical protein [Actinomycetota bacterium]